ncbi:MAG: hypothetical protein JNM89_09275 [Hyphomicrobiaceae bacterium]|nr:hypothetical protein [Hyphomicrobiaceae bacterium]
MTNDDLEGLEVEELEKRLTDLERAHHKEMIRYEASLLFPALLGIPLGVGFLATVLVLLTGKPGDLGQVALGVGATLAVGAVIAAVFWLGMQAWARWRY